MRKFDLDREHKGNKSAYQEKRRPYGHGLDTSSSDDEDYQYRGKPIQKKELISPVKEKDYFNNFYGKARDNVMQRKIAKNWLGKTKFDDEWSDDDFKVCKRKEDNNKYLAQWQSKAQSSVSARQSASFKTPQPQARKVTALEKKIMEKLQSGQK